MRLAAPLALAFRAVRARPGRGLLLAVTAALAVATMVATRTLLDGQLAGMLGMIDQLGLRTVQVQPLPGKVGATPLTSADLVAAQEAAEPLGARVLPAVIAIANLDAGEDRVVRAVPVLGTTDAYLTTLDVQLAEGRFFDGRESDEAERVIVLDKSLADRLWPEGGAVGKPLSIATGGPRGEYRVVGVLSDPVGIREQMDQFDQLDQFRNVASRVLTFRNAYVPRGCFRGDRISALMAVARDPGEVDELERTLSLSLAAEDRGLFVWARKSWMELLSGMLEDQTALGDIVWGVVLLVAVVSAGTLALMVSADRTAEIGIRRAEGASGPSVFAQFVAEGAVFGLVGGLAGVPVGAAVGHLLAAQVGLFAITTGRTMVDAVFVAAAAGVLAALAPAVRAARLDPVEALRAA